MAKYYMLEYTVQDSLTNVPETHRELVEGELRLDEALEFLEGRVNIPDFSVKIAPLYYEKDK